MRPPRVSLAIAIVVVAVSSSACGSSSSPTSPTTVTTPAVTTTATVLPTRVIGVSGNLAFGQLAIGATQTASFTIANSGNSTLAVIGIGAQSSFVSQSALNWATGRIEPGASQTVIITFRPTTAGTYSGLITINADHTSGANTIAYSATVTDPNVFNGNWSGTYVVQSCLGEGSVQDVLCSAPAGSRPGGVFPLGTSLPISLSLSQRGNLVTGTWTLGTVIGTVTGSVTNGVLTLEGTARSNMVTSVIGQWTTQAVGNRMTGTATFNTTANGIPGVGILGVTLTVTK